MAAMAIPLCDIWLVTFHQLLMGKEEYTITEQSGVTLDAAQPTSQVNGDRRGAEERGRFSVKLKVLMALAPGPNVP